jgi:hypothetical protein
MRISQGNQGYSDFEPPYTPIVQTDWSGGRGSDDFDKAANRYYDGFRADTIRGDIIMGGKKEWDGMFPRTSWAHIFEYKRQIYLATTDGNIGMVYMNGYRGLETRSNGSALQNDYTGQTFTRNELIGCIIEITGGQGYLENKRWRKIIANTTNGIISVDEPWLTPHNTTTEYVILGTNKWSIKYSAGHPITDVLVVDECVYLAMGESYNIRRFMEKNIGNVWTLFTDEENTHNNKATFLAYVCASDGERYVWRANSSACSASKAPVVYWTDLIFGDEVICGSKSSKITGMQVYGDRPIPYIFKEDEIGAISTENFGTTSTGETVGIPDEDTGDNTSYSESDEEGGSETSSDTTGTHTESGTTSWSKSTTTGWQRSKLESTNDTEIVTKDVYARVPIGELRSVKDPRNGVSHLHHGTYLYFSLLDGIERYFGNNLDDIGPNRDEGLPANRRGAVKKMVGYPGRIYVMIDQTDIAGYGSILCYNGTGWNEAYRTDAGVKLAGMEIQTLNGMCDRIVFLETVPTYTRVCSIPIAIDPRKDEYYKYTDQAQIVSSWMYASLKDVIKFWKEISLFTEDLLVNVRTITIEYQTDNETTTWHTLPDTFIESPVDKSDIAAANNVVGRRLRYRITMNNLDETKTMRILAADVDSVTRIPVKNSWTLTFLAEDSSVDLRGKRDPVDAYQLITQLATWADSRNTPAPLAMRSLLKSFDDKLVFIDPPSIQPLQVVIDAQNRAKLLGTLTVFEA